MRLKHIEVLHAIMVAGSLSGAARLLNVTQPAVSQALQHAELQLGYLLFSRTGNRLVPTRETLTLYAEVDRLFSQLDAVRTLASNLRQGAQQELRVLIPPSLSPHVFPQALKHFRRKFRSMPLSIRTLHSRDIVTALGLREGDLGIVYGTHPHPGVVETPVATGHLMCLMAAPPPRRKTVALTELSGQPVIRIHPQDPIGFVLNDMTTRLGVRFVGGITVQTYQAALSLAEYGFGPAIVDEFTLAGRQYRDLKALRVEPAVPVQLNALRPTQGDELAASAYLTDCIRKVAQAIIGTRPASSGRRKAA